MNAVARPDHRAVDRVPGRERFYRQHIEHGRWLRVVVQFDDGDAWIVTARALDTPEGHTVEYDEQGAVVGLELMGVRGALERVSEPRTAATNSCDPSQSASERMGQSIGREGEMCTRARCPSQ